MAPTRTSRKSTPAFTDGAAPTPSRRSPRAPVATKAANDSVRSPKSLDPASSPTSEDIRFYYPKTPPSSNPLQTSSPELPSTRRRIFQARPSRLSNVYTPVVESPNSSSQDSRKTRRMTALDTPSDLLSNKDNADNMGSTGWTYDQYMGGLDDTTEPPSPSAASSKGTRSSARLRKPTTRAIEALELQKKPRRKNTGLAPDSAPAATDTTATSTPVLAPAKDETSESAAQATKKTARKPLRGKKTRRSLKQHKQKKPQLLRIEVDIDTAGHQLYQAAVEALGTGSTLPSDPVWVINEARFAYSQSKSGAQRTRKTSAGDEHQPDLYDSETGASSIGKFKKSTAPQVEPDGWSRIGRINSRGEELMIPPANYDLYWSPRTYGDERLPFPPVRSRSEQQAGKDNALGFPPLIGDRNIPFDIQSQFVAEDISEEKARVQARDEARQRAADAPIRTRKPRKAKHRQNAPAPIADLPAASDNEEPESKPKPKRRRGGARASLPTTTAAPTTPKSGSTVRTPRSRATKSTAKKPAAATVPVPAPAPAPTADDNEEVRRPIIRLKLRAPKPEYQLESPAEPNAPQPTETSRAGKGKKRLASSIDEDDAAGGSSSTKRARMAGNSDLESTPKSGRRTPARKSTPTSKVKEHIDEEASGPELPSGKASTPKPERSSCTPKGPRRAASLPASRGRGRTRGRGRG